jgi:hypothetical protein
MIPEEDRGPAWLRDYGFTDFGDIAADINAMQEYAQKLAADVDENFTPHFTGMTAAMETPLPVADSNFYELSSFVEAHKAVRGLTQDNMYAFGHGTSVFAAAAQKVSHEYRGTDAFAHAKAADIHKVMGTSVPTPTTDEGSV